MVYHWSRTSVIACTLYIIRKMYANRNALICNNILFGMLFDAIGFFGYIFRNQKNSRKIVLYRTIFAIFKKHANFYSLFVLPFVLSFVLSFVMPFVNGMVFAGIFFGMIFAGFASKACRQRGRACHRGYVEIFSCLPIAFYCVLKAIIKAKFFYIFLKNEKNWNSICYCFKKRKTHTMQN